MSRDAQTFGSSISPIWTSDLGRTLRSTGSSIIPIGPQRGPRSHWGRACCGTTHAARRTAACRSERQRALPAFVVRFGELVEGETRLGQDGLPGLGRLMTALGASWPTWRPTVAGKEKPARSRLPGGTFPLRI